MDTTTQSPALPDADTFRQTFHITAYLDAMTLERGASPKTVYSYTGTLTQFGRYAWRHGVTSVPEVTLDFLRRYLHRLWDRGLSPTSISGHLSIIQNYFRFLVEEGYVTHDPSERLERPKRVRVLPPVLTVEEVDRLLAATQTHHRLALRDRAMFELAYGAGLRIGEWIMLKVEHVNLTDGTVRVFGKGSKERIVPIGSSAIQAITDYLQQLRPTLMGTRTSRILFLTTTGTHLSRQAIGKRLKRYVERAGITKHTTAHTLRRSFATHLLANGADLIAIRDMLGHVDIGTTEIYTRVDVTQLHATHHAHHPRSQLPAPSQPVPAARNASITRYLHQFRRRLIRNLQGPAGRRRGPQMSLTLEERAQYQRRADTLMNVFHMNAFWTYMAQERHVSLHTASAQSTPLAAFLVFVAGHGIASVTAIDDAVIQHFFATVATRLAPISLPVYRSVIRSYCRFAMGKASLPGDPMAARHPLAHLTAETVQQLLDIQFATGRYSVRNRALLALAWDTKLGVKALAALHVTQVDVEQCIVRSRHRDGVEYGFPVRPATMDLLRCYRDTERPSLDHTGGMTALFLTDRGRPLSYQAITSLFQHYLQRAGLQK